MIISVRQRAVELLTKVDDGGLSLPQAMASASQPVRFSPEDRRFLTELTHGCLRRRLSLDYALGFVSKRPLVALPNITKNLLRVGAYQILYMPNIPQGPVVHEMVAAARAATHEGVAKFVNAVLRSLIRTMPGIAWPQRDQDFARYIEIVHSYPRWLVESWMSRLDRKGVEALAEALNTPPSAAVMVNNLRTTRPRLEEELRSADMFSHSSALVPDGICARSQQLLLHHPGLNRGHYYIQSESSMFPVYAARLQPGMTVYDLCSAPGGKTGHMAQVMGNQGRITAFDQSLPRIRRLEQNMKRLGVDIVEAKCADAAGLDAPPVERVFLDAPCSGLGTINHKPEGRWQKDPVSIRSLVSLQRRLLETAAALTAPGGLLIYSTCTNCWEENQGQIAWFLERQRQFQLHPLPWWFPEHSTRGVVEIWPHLHRTDGFFCACLQRNN